jgi:hypothetical protein
MNVPEDELRRDLAASIEARRELGPAYEDELVQSFVDRVDMTVRQRVDAQLEERPRGDDNSREQFVLALASVGTGIPITAIATSNSGTAATVVAWAGIVGVNAAYAWSRGRQH